MSEDTAASLINWVNTIDDSLCALVSSEADLADGTVLTAIVNHWAYETPDSHVMSLLREDPSPKNVIWNFGVFLTELMKICDDSFVRGLDPCELATDSQTRFSVLQFLRDFSLSEEFKSFKKTLPSGFKLTKKLVPLVEEKESFVAHSLSARPASPPPENVSSSLPLSNDQLISWLQQIRVLPSTKRFGLKTLPFQSRDGRLALKLAMHCAGKNYYESKEEPRSFDAQYQNFVQASNLFSKTGGNSLRSLSEDKILLLMAGEENAFFAFISEVHKTFGGKVRKTRESQTPTRSVTPVKIVKPTPPEPKSRLTPVKQMYHNPIEVESNPRSYSTSPLNKTTSSFQRTYYSRFERKPALPQFSHAKTPSDSENLTRSINKISPLELAALDFLSSLGLEDLIEGYRDQPLLKDPMRNGVLMCYVVNRAFNAVMKQVCVEPQSYSECIDNFAKAITACKQFELHHIGQRLELHMESIMKGNYTLLFRVLRELQDDLKEGNPEPKKSQQIDLKRYANLSSTRV